MTLKFGESTAATFKQWEAAGVSLSLALSHYLNSSRFLLDNSLAGDKDKIDLASRIDSSLQILHTALDRQLAEARVALSKTRNRIMSRIYCFPEEILSEIFMRVVYDHDDKVDNRPGMEKRVRTIYQHLHTLLSVCTAWRRIGITRQAFWSIIPIIDPDIGFGPPRFHSTEIGLQRAGHQGLHLAVRHKDHPVYSRDKRIGALAGNFHRFRSVNVDLESLGDIFAILTALLEQGAAETISQLSLSHSYKYGDIHHAPHPSDYFNHADCTVLPQFTKMMYSLSALRISNILFRWREIAFTDRLTELRVQKVRIVGLSEVNQFLGALASARGLRNLTMIGVEMVDAPGGHIVPGPPISLPQLQTVYLEDLYINMIFLVLGWLINDSFHLALNLSENAFYNLVGYSDIESVDLDYVCDTLVQFSVDKLIIEGSVPDWASKDGLHRLLLSVRSVKALILNFFELDEELLEALVPKVVPRTQTDPFPQLERIEFRSASLLDDGEGLKTVVANHPIQTLVLSGYVRQTLEDDYEDIPFKGDESIVRWLQSNVSGFEFAEDELDAPESTDADWQLWDF